jgi:S-formylglutathione hydrolase FrmB
MKSCSLAIILFSAASAFAAEDANISPAKKDEHGFLIHEVESPLQAGKTLIRLLLPTELKPDQKYPVIYVLPVEAKSENRYGDGLIEVARHDLHNKRGTIFVAPTFSHLPWYADHPTDPSLRQESYFLQVVVPFVEKSYPAQAKATGRLLLGFSKSGWGAWSLLLRHPDIFGRASAWDAPLMLDRPGKYGSGDIFGTQENFDEYHVAKLLRDRKELLGRDKRLILTGYGNFRKEHEQMHVLADELKISHDYRDGPQRKHDWHSGWVEEAVKLLMEQKE